MRKEYISTWQRWFFRIVLFVLAFTGIGQMPLYPRYRLSSVPGMAWTKDFYLLHWAHYVGAALLLLFLGYVAARYVAEWSRDHQITGWGWIRLALWAVLLGTGGLRVIKNMPDIHFSAMNTLLIDWVHLAAAMFLGIAALAALLRHKKAYMREKG